MGFVFADTTFVLLHQKVGTFHGMNVGLSMAGIGDVDGDGKSDFIIGANERAYVFSGATGNQIYELVGESNGDHFGNSVAGVGDIDGDTVPDFVIGARQPNPQGENSKAGSIYVYSGSDGSLLYKRDGDSMLVNFGYSVIGLGDVDGDEKPDFIVGAPYRNPNGVFQGGTIYVYSGSTGTLIYQINGTRIGQAVGLSVGVLGDVNGDGKADFIVGDERGGGGGGLGPNGAAYVYSGATGALLYQITGDNSGDRLGNSVAGVGDVNGDSVPDFIVGAYGSNSSAGSARVCSGLNGSLIHQVNGAVAGDAMGFAVGGAGDVDGDGKGDFLVGAIWARPGGINSAGTAYLYSGANSSLLFRVDGTANSDLMGWLLAGVGDVSGDGLADFAVGTPYADIGGFNDAGVAMVISKEPAPLVVTAVLDPGTGDKLLVKWNPIDETDITEYQIGIGTSPTVYSPPYLTEPATGQVNYQKIISDLQTATPYYVAVRGHNENTGEVSVWATARVPDTAVYATRPVVMVHGYKSGPDMWNYFNQLLQANKFNYVWVADNIGQCGGIFGETDFSTNALNLSDFIEAKVSGLIAQTQIEPTIDIIGYDMGGLIARRYISGTDSWAHLRQVKNLVMLGTPNLGLKAGNPCRGYVAITCPAPCEMSYERMLEFNLRYLNVSGTLYHTAAGTGGRKDCDCYPFPNLDCTRHNGLEGCPWDAVVPVSSVEGIPHTGQIRLCICRTEYHTSQYLFYNFILPILKGQIVSQAQSTKTVQVVNGGSTPSQISFQKCDSIMVSEPRTDTLNVESGVLEVLMLATDSMLSFTLQSPSGMIWDSLSAESDTNVIYSADDQGRGFLFKNAEIGTWLVHYDPQNITQSPAYYCLYGIINNTVILEASISKTYPSPIDSVIILATITDGGVAVLGANVTILPVHENVDTLPVVDLLDDGNHGDGIAEDGIYGAVFNQTSDTGLVTFDLVATGTGTSVGEFRRQASLALYITRALCAAKPGDVAVDNSVNLADIIFLVNSVFKGGTKPSPLCRGDVNASGGNPNLTDIIYLVNRIFKGGPAPVKSGVCCL